MSKSAVLLLYLIFCAVCVSRHGLVNAVVKAPTYDEPAHTKTQRADVHDKGNQIPQSPLGDDASQGTIDEISTEIILDGTASFRIMRNFVDDSIKEIMEAVKPLYEEDPSALDSALKFEVQVMMMGTSQQSSKEGKEATLGMYLVQTYKEIKRTLDLSMTKYLLVDKETPESAFRLATQLYLELKGRIVQDFVDGVSRVFQTTMKMKTETAQKLEKLFDEDPHPSFRQWVDWISNFFFFLMVLLIGLNECRGH